MRFYADADWPLDPEWVRTAVLAGLRQPPPGGGRAVEQARDGLIAAGMLEQALADRPIRDAAQREVEAIATDITDAWAARLAAAMEELAGPTNAGGPGRMLSLVQDQATLFDVCAAPTGTPPVGVGRGSAIRPHPRWGFGGPSNQTKPADLRPSVASGQRSEEALLASMPGTACLPEGYLFYGVYPDHYLQVGRRLAAVVGRGPFVVVGVRSIGASLSAAVAAGLRAAGCSVCRSTVRPVGDPFEREVELEDTVAREWRAAAARGATFIAVDEGPGLSGSSLAATVAALERCGAVPGAVHVVCAVPSAMPMASAATRAIWARCRCWAAQEDAERFWHEQLPALLGADSRAVRIVRDLSWGAWTEVIGAGGDRPLLPHLERRKILLEWEGKSVLAKFVGFGAVGRRKAALAAHLAAAGFTPPVYGYAHGMLLLEWEERYQAARAGPDADTVIPAAARYYAHLHAHCATGEPAPLEEIGAIARAIARDWLGSTPDMDRLARQAAHGKPRALHGDQKPEPVEWRMSGRTVRKYDAADHFLDHSWAREQDIGFDLAGFAQECAHQPAQERALIWRYVEESGDRGVEARLPFYRVVYAAHRLAALDTAYHAARPYEREAIEAARQRAGAALATAVQSGDAPR